MYPSPPPPRSNMPRNSLERMFAPDGKLKAKNALDRLGALPGMAEVKAQVEQMIQFAKVSKLRERQGLKSEPQSNHMLFTGNPGTGKTTAARLIGEAFAGMGLLKSSGEDVPFVEVHHADVTHPHVGQAERTMKEKFAEAKGGVLFIDESYAFIAGKTEHRSEEKLVAVIVQLMEDMRDEIMVIAAGYPKEMQKFVESNPGLRSRFSNTLHFPDYEVPDLIRIAETMLEDREYMATPDYLDALASVLWIEKAKPHFGNARTVRNHVERSIRQQAMRISRIANPGKPDLVMLRSEDIVHDAQGVRRAEKDVLQELIRSAQNRLLEIELREIMTSR